MKQLTKFLCNVLSACLSVFIAMPSFADENRKLHMACGPFPPYKIENGQNPGIDIEVMEAAWAETGWSTYYKYYPYKRALKMTTEGLADGLCGCSYKENRETAFRFSDVMGHHSQGIFVRADKAGKPIRALSDLKGKKVATVRGYVTQKELDAQNIEYRGVLDDAQLITMLLKDRVDAIYAYRDVILHALNKDDKVNQVVYYEISRQPYYVCISRSIPDSQAITEDLNRGLRVIRKNGTYSKIWRSYLSIN